MGMNLGGPSKKGRASPEMNVTPLVDVVLVLLIIFMVITPLLTKQFWIFLPNDPEPEAAPPPPDAPEAVVVSVDAEGRVHINRDIVPVDQLEARLRRVLAARTDRTIFFDAANEAPFEKAVEALDHARGGGASSIAVSIQPLVDRD